MRVEVLYFQDCPNHGPTVELVRGVAEDLGIEAEVREVEVKDADDATRLRFLGSPTVQVNGVDIEPEARDRTDFAFGCRVYGKLGVPPYELVARALKDASATEVMR